MLLGVQIGAPYNAIGLINESNNVVSDFKDSCERIIVRLRPKNSPIAFAFRFDCAVLTFQIYAEQCQGSNMSQQCEFLALMV